MEKLTASVAGDPRAQACPARSSRRAAPARYDITGRDRGHHGDPGRLVRADGHRVREAGHPVRARVLGAGHRASAGPRRSSACWTPATRPARRTTATRRCTTSKGATVLFLSDEHASLAIPADSPLRVGDRRAARAVAHRPDDQPARRVLRARRRSGRRRLADHGARLQRAARKLAIGRHAGRARESHSASGEIPHRGRSV